jgi:hypothetical protein
MVIAAASKSNDVFTRTLQVLLTFATPAERYPSAVN